MQERMEYRMAPEEKRCRDVERILEARAECLESGSVEDSPCLGRKSKADDGRDPDTGEQPLSHTDAPAEKNSGVQRREAAQRGCLAGR